MSGAATNGDWVWHRPVRAFEDSPWVRDCGECGTPWPCSEKALNDCIDGTDELVPRGAADA